MQASANQAPRPRPRLRLRELREERGLTQAQVAELLDVTPSMVCHYEKGDKYMTLDKFVFLLDYFNISYKDLLVR